MVCEEQLEAIPPAEFGRLYILDELFNALHGVGDVDPEVKKLVIEIVFDIHDGGQKVVSASKDKRQAEFVLEIVKIIAAASRNKPETLTAILKSWLNEISQKKGAMT